jgi:hypothetical protein
MDGLPLCSNGFNLLLECLIPTGWEVGWATEDSYILIFEAWLLISYQPIKGLAVLPSSGCEVRDQISCVLCKLFMNSNETLH